MPFERTDADRKLVGDVQTLLAGLKPTLPVTLEDAAAVFTMLRPLVLRPYLLDVYSAGSTIVVTVKRDNEQILGSTLTAS